ncbi:zinc finger protein 106-like [Xenia sp. Carnegie-2017]|uniref:zinc finger protein 106-like n=1 Tax=Xenia sp. Carnegie-2017 TaxID=2897299 RepID=UPI001F03FDDB|nr:zinc finger protein 106-like [Xenia sp. Carnegie-2017]
MSVSGLQALGGVLVTSSLDKIVRCYDIETGELLQLYGGNTNMIFSLCVLGNMIYTGCRDGRLSSVKLDLRKYHSCKWRNCSLKFGVLSHFKQHVEDHINETVNLKDCLAGMSSYVLRPQSVGGNSSEETHIKSCPNGLRLHCCEWNLIYCCRVNKYEKPKLKSELLGAIKYQNNNFNVIIS